jgi:cyclic pyranopterin phosphate synthase
VIFSFEEPNTDLIWIPLAARRALDAAGLGLSLAAWRSLPMSAREALITAGSSHDVDIATVERHCSTAERVPVIAESTRAPSEVLSLLPERTSDIERAWPALSPLERYALAKLATNPRRAAEDRKVRLIQACDVILPAASGLTHLTPTGDAHMVDVSQKSATARTASARAFVRLKPETLDAIRGQRTPKGDVLAVARIAGIQAAKRTPDLIPLCHSIALTGVEVSLRLSDEPCGIYVDTLARATDRTGVEMEALVAASTAALTLYDMLKSLDRGMTITDLELTTKSGGRSGDYVR